MSQNSQKSAQAPKTAITPTREQDFPGWYQEVIKAADMAENSPVRGCMTIKPYGFAVWENIQKIFDAQLKDYGIQNCAFPLLIPVSFLAKEAEHVEGFAKECAVVTHHRLEAGEDGTLIPSPGAKLEEPYVVRPTSETIIGEAMSRWIQSYRDLPMKLNQWASVMRWELRTRMFLRTSEFFWHEGHNAFEDKAGAEKDCLVVLDMYQRFFEEYLAFSGYKGVKTPEERFPGADDTYAIESLMQDGKALQAATTHNLGTNFSESCGIKYQSRSGSEEYAHTTSWAFSSRVIGAMIMIHGDDDGMIMPPRIAPQQIVILPVLKDESATPRIMEFCRRIAAELKALGLRPHVDDRDIRTPDKMWEAIKKGIPLRVEIGQREMEDSQVTIVRRDLGRESKRTLSADQFVMEASNVLDDIHAAMLARSRALSKANSHSFSSLKDMEAHFAKDGKGFAVIDSGLLSDPDLERIKKEHSLTARCMPLDQAGKVIIAKAY